MERDPPRVPADTHLPFIVRLADALERSGRAGASSGAAAQRVSELLRGTEEAAAAIRSEAEAEALRSEAEALRAAAAGLAGAAPETPGEAGAAMPGAERRQGTAEARRNVAKTMSVAGFSGKEIERFLEAR